MNNYVCLYKTQKKLPIVLSKSEACGNVSMRKVTQIQTLLFTLWLWSRCMKFVRCVYRI
jgi:hypothetical protein